MDFSFTRVRSTSFLFCVEFCFSPGQEIELFQSSCLVGEDVGVIIMLVDSAFNCASMIGFRKNFSGSVKKGVRFLVARLF